MPVTRTLQVTAVALACQCSNVLQLELERHYITGMPLAVACTTLSDGGLVVVLVALCTAHSSSMQWYDADIRKGLLVLVPLHGASFRLLVPLAHTMTHKQTH